MKEKIEKLLRRYELIEASCDRARCVPCTYPNCQRFVREKKAVAKAFPA
jgi:hypothetical protein